MSPISSASIMWASRWTDAEKSGLTGQSPLRPKSEGYGQGSAMRVAAQQLPQITEMLLIAVAPKPTSARSCGNFRRGRRPSGSKSPGRARREAHATGGAWIRVAIVSAKQKFYI
jgi:hypothetical protein